MTSADNIASIVHSEFRCLINASFGIMRKIIGITVTLSSRLNFKHTATKISSALTTVKISAVMEDEVIFV